MLHPFANPFRMHLLRVYFYVGDFWWLGGYFCMAMLTIHVANSCLAPPRATQRITQNPTSAPPRTCRTAPTVLLRVEDMLRTSLSAGRRRATLIRQAAPSPRAKAAIGWRGAVAVVWHTVWATPMHGSP